MKFCSGIAINGYKFKKILSVFCVLMLIVGAIYLPLEIKVKAAAPITVTEGETVLFDFTENIGNYNSKDNVNEFNTNGLGILGWANTFTAAIDDPDNTVCANVGTTKVQNYATFGAMRLHKKVNNAYQVYNLEPDTQYVVTLKVRVISSSDFTDDAKTPHECYVSMGYGTYKERTDTNYLTNMQKTLVKVVSAKAGSGVYTLSTDMKNKKQLDCGTEWQEVIYTFTTPADLGEKDHALAFYSTTRTNFRAEFDDVAVTKLGDNNGAVLLVDDYSAKTEVKFGKVGEKVDLPDISDRATDSKHKFLGWFSDDTYSEKITSFKIVKGVSSVYSNWSKPVKITFKDTLNGTSTTLEGMAGDELTFPERPFDKNNKAWFLGWYTDESYSLEFTDNKFGFADMTLFSRWQTEYLELTQDFENYEKDAWEIKDRTSGSITFKDKSNSYYFANCFSKEQFDGDYAVKLNWNPTMQKDITKADGVNLNDPEAYDAKTRYNGNANVVVLGEHLENFHQYKMTFKYKVIKADTDISFYAATAVRYNIYGSANYSDNHHLELKESDEWQEFSFNFNTNFVAENGKGIFLGFVLDKNAEVVMYIDDVRVESLTTPAQSLITLVKNNGEENESVIALKGKALKLPTPKHPDNADFLGWYIDSALTESFNETVCPDYNVMLYAKWSNVAISFKTYPFDTANNGKLVHIENKKDIGLNDDYAAHWQFDGSLVYRPAADSGTGKDVLWATRGNQNDHVLKIAEKLENGAVYKISFNYKVSSNTNVATTITPLSAHRSNIYLTACLNAYSMNTVKISEGGVKWSKAEYYISANVKSSGVYVGDSLYLSFKTATNDEKNKADIFIDELLVQKVEAPYVFFDCQNSENLIMVDGAKGDKITVPKVPQKFAHVFTGWYTDIECTKKFEKEVFEGDEAITVYAGWKKANTATTSFENYLLSALGDCVIDKTAAVSGKYSAHFGNRTEGNFRAMSYFAVGDGNVPFEVEVGKRYVATFKYRINKEGTTDLTLDFVSASPTNFWVAHTNNLILSDPEKISTGNQAILKGKWLTMSMLIDTKALKEEGKSIYDVLYLRLRGIENGDVSIDDLTITELSNGKSVALIDNSGCSFVPSYITGNNKTNFFNKLPKNPEVKNKKFIGYYTADSAGKLIKLEPEKAVFAAAKDKPIRVFAKFVDEKVTENFEDGEYVKTATEYKNIYTIYDFDYEIYDSAKKGNNKDNVTSGRYSLHRKGENEFFENAVLLVFKNQIAEGQRYNVKFKVKMGKALHTDGAIKIASGRSWFYSWTTTGDYYPVVAISDLADGNWHEVSYTFNAVEAFAVIQTPGYVELFMDDFEFTLVDKSTPTSVPVTFTEYVPALRNADGSLVNGDNSTFDVTKIIDESIYEKNFNLLWIIVPVASVILVLALVLILKKKKA